MVRPIVAPKPRMQQHVVRESWESMADVIAKLPDDQAKPTPAGVRRSTRLVTRRHDKAFRPGEKEDRPFRTLSKFVSVTDVVNESTLVIANKRVPPARAHSTDGSGDVLAAARAVLRKTAPTRSQSYDGMPGLQQPPSYLTRQPKAAAAAILPVSKKPVSPTKAAKVAAAKPPKTEANTKGKKSRSNSITSSSNSTSSSSSSISSSSSSSSAASSVVLKSPTKRRAAPARSKSSDGCAMAGVTADGVAAARGKKKALPARSKSSDGLQRPQLPVSPLKSSMKKSVPPPFSSPKTPKSVSSSPSSFQQQKKSIHAESARGVQDFPYHQKSPGRSIDDEDHAEFHDDDEEEDSDGQEQQHAPQKPLVQEQPAVPAWKLRLKQQQEEKAQAAAAANTKKSSSPSAVPAWKLKLKQQQATTTTSSSPSKTKVTPSWKQKKDSMQSEEEDLAIHKDGEENENTHKNKHSSTVSRDSSGDGDSAAEERKKKKKKKAALKKKKLQQQMEKEKAEFVPPMEIFCG